MSVSGVVAGPWQCGVYSRPAGKPTLRCLQWLYGQNMSRGRGKNNRQPGIICPQFFEAGLEQKRGPLGHVCVPWWQVHTLRLFSSVWNLEVTAQTATFLSYSISDGARGFRFPLTGLSLLLCTVNVSQLDCISAA